MNIDSTKGPQVVKQGIRIEANSIREAQKSKDGLSYMPQNQYNINDDLYSKSQSTGTTAYMYHESNKKLNNSNQKTAEINLILQRALQRLLPKQEHGNFHKTVL